LPRIGAGTPEFNWYSTERVLRSSLVTRGIPTFVYYFKRKKHGKYHKNFSPFGKNKPKFQSPKKQERKDEDNIEMESPLKKIKSAE
jgi:hypothetical protein